MPGAGRNPAAQLGGEIDPIDGVDHGKPPHRVARLVPLKRTDQMPGHGHAAQQILFLDCFLHAILADIAKTGVDRSTHRRWRMGLGDRHDAHVVGPSPDRLVPGHDVADLGKAAGKGREIHSL